MPRRIAVLLAAATLIGACDRSGVAASSTEPSDGSGSGQSAAAAADGALSDVRPEELIVEVRVAASENMSDRGVRIAPGRMPVQLYARVLDSERNPLDTRVVWHSLDPERVDVDAFGRLSALGPLGPAFVTASSGQVIAEPMPVYVVPAAQLPPEPVDEEGSAAGTEPIAGSGDPSGAGPTP